MGKIKVLPTSRVGIGPLAEMAAELRAMLPGWEDTQPGPERPRGPSDLRLDLEHLAHHDTNGLLVASEGAEVLGFVASFVRSRYLVLSQLWVLPELAASEVPRTLVRRALVFGERSGTSKVVFHALTPWQLALGVQFALTPVFPCLRLGLSLEQAQLLGHQLSRLLPGAEVTKEALERRAYFADLERLDRLVRGFARPMDHEYWLLERNLQLAVVREGERITAYGYGGAEQCGPVVGATEEAALAALGWALQFAASAPSEKRELSLLVPVSFAKAVEQLLEGAGRVLAASFWLANEAPRASYFVPASLSLL